MSEEPSVVAMVVGEDTMEAEMEEVDTVGWAEMAVARVERNGESSIRHIQCNRARSQVEQPSCG